MPRRPHCLLMQRLQRFEAPRADYALLLYLASVTALLGLFAWSFYALMQPTVVPNLGMANYKEPGRATAFLHRLDSSFEEMERTAIAAALQDNKEQGIEPARAFASAERAETKSNGSHADVTPVAAKQPKRQPPKRVVRREPVADTWHSWEVASRSNARFGFGNRPFWSGGFGHF